MDKKKYFVFISYSSKDNEDDNKWAEWLRYELDHWHLPATYSGVKPQRDNLREVFRDRDGFSAGGDWWEQAKGKLKQTQNLIVICSPNAKNSSAVNQEVEFFIDELNKGNDDNVYPFIIEGNSPDECFPKALRHNKVGGDVSKDGGRDAAFIKVVAGMLGVDFIDLYNRYELEKAEQERKEREEKEKLQIIQSRFLAEKATQLIAEGNSLKAMLLALEATAPNRPYVAEAEAALRKAVKKDYDIFRTPGTSSTIAISPDGVYCAYTIQNNVILINLIDGTRKVIYTHHKNTISSLAFSHDSTKITTCSLYDTTIKIWDVENSKLPMNIIVKSKYEAAYGIMFSPNDNNLMAYDDEAISIWNVQTGELICTIGSLKERRKYNNRFTYASFNHNGDKIISASELTLITIWDSSTGKILDSFRGHEKEITQVQFYNDDNFIITSSLDKTVKLWNNKTIVSSFDGHESGVSRFILYNDKIITASIEGIIRFWDIKEQTCIKVLKGHSQAIRSLAILELDDTCLYSSSDDETIRIWYTKADYSDFTLYGHKDLISCVRLSNDGKKIVSTDSKEIKIWDLNNGKCLKTFSEQSRYTDSVCFSPKDDLILTASSDNMIKFFDSETGILKKTLSGHNDYINTICFNNDGSQIVSASVDTTIKIWDSLTCSCLFTLVGHSGSVNSAIFDKSGQLVASASSDNTIKIWNARTGELRSTLLGHSAQILSIDFSPDGTKLVSSSRDNLIKIWDIGNDSLINTLEGHEGSSVLSVSFSNNDGKYIVSAANDNTIRIWDVSSGVNLDTFIGHTSYVRSAIFSSDNQLIISGSNDKTIKIWSLTNLQEVINEAQEMTEYIIVTDEFRKKYYLE